MKKIRKKLLPSVLLVLLLAITPTAYAVDVYLVYSGADKAIKKALKKALPSNLKIKTYNIDLLVMADYSGKQKAIAKISKATVVVLIKNKPKEALEGAYFSNVVSVASAEDIGMIVDKLK